jgi:hypothetical protein
LQLVFYLFLLFRASAFLPVLLSNSFWFLLFFPQVATNGLQLGEVAEIEAQMFGFVQKFNRRTAVEFSTKPAILPNCC